MKIPCCLSRGNGGQVGDKGFVMLEHARGDLQESFHAGAETHIYAKNKHKSDEKFSPFLFGVADIYNMHSNAEYMNIESFYKGYELAKEIFIEFNNI